MPNATSLADLGNKISEALNVYKGAVLTSIADHMDECANVFMENAKLPYADGGSPYDEDNVKTPHYRDSWKVKNMKKAKYVRYIGNTKKVKAHYKDDVPTIPLINILEYAKDKRARPHVDSILSKSEGKIVDIIVSNIRKEGK